MRFRRVPSREKPREGTYVLDRGHPLARRLLFYAPGTEGGGLPHDLVANAGTLSLNAATWSITPYGLGWGTPPDFNSYAVKNAPTDYPMTIAAMVMTTGSANSFAFGVANAGLSEFFYVGCTGTTGTPILRASGNDLNVGPDIGERRAGLVVGVLESATSRRLYSNGRLCGTQATSVTFPTLANWIVGSAVSTPTMRTLQCAAWGRTLSDAEILAWWNEPWLLLVQPRRVRYPVAAAPTTPTSMSAANQLVPYWV